MPTKNPFIKDHFPDGVPTQPNLTEFSDYERVKIIFGRIALELERNVDSSFPSRSDRINLKKALYDYYLYDILPENSYLKLFMQFCDKADAYVIYCFLDQGSLKEKMHVFLHELSSKMKKENAQQKPKAA